MAKYDHINFSPPDGVRSAARRGLDYRSKYGRGGTKVGIARARDLANGRDMSPDTIKRMVSFFARHQSNRNPDKRESDGGPTNGWIAWLLWGGDPGRSWSSKVSKQMKAADAKSSSKMSEAAHSDMYRHSHQHQEHRRVEMGNHAGRRFSEDSVYFASDIEEYVFSEHMEASCDKEYKAGDVVDLPLFREGKFKHPWYGEIKYSAEDLNRIVSNFKKKAYPQEIHGNIDHYTKYGALGWIDSDRENALYIRKKILTTPVGDIARSFLFGKVTLNEEGAKAMNCKKYRYISAEISNNYTTREKYAFEEISSMTGPGTGVEATEEEDGSWTISYGKTLVGFAFTNRPFMPGMMSVFSDGGGQLEEEPYTVAMAQSEDGGGDLFSVSYDSMKFSDTGHSVSRDDDFYDDVAKTGSFSRESHRDFDDQQPCGILGEQIGSTGFCDPGTEQSQNHTVPESGGTEMFKFSQIKAKMDQKSDDQDKLLVLLSMKPSVNDEELAILEFTEQVLRDKISAQQAAEDLSQKLAFSKRSLEESAKKNSELMQQVAEAKLSSVGHQVSATRTRLEQMGFTNPMLDEFDKVFSNVSPSTMEHAFSVRDEHGEEKERVDVLEIIERIFSAAPKELFINTGVDEADEVVLNNFTANDPEEVVTSQPVEESEEDKRVRLYTDKYGHAPASFLIPLIKEDGSLDDSIN